MIFLWVALFILYVILAISYIVSWRKWQQEIAWRKAERQGRR